MSDNSKSSEISASSEEEIKTKKNKNKSDDDEDSESESEDDKNEKSDEEENEDKDSENESDKESENKKESENNSESNEESEEKSEKEEEEKESGSENEKSNKKEEEKIKNKKSKDKKKEEKSGDEEEKNNEEKSKNNEKKSSKDNKEKSNNQEKNVKELKLLNISSKSSKQKSITTSNNKKYKLKNSKNNSKSSNVIIPNEDNLSKYDNNLTFISKSNSNYSKGNIIQSLRQHLNHLEQKTQKLESINSIFYNMLIKNNYSQNELEQLNQKFRIKNNNSINNCFLPPIQDNRPPNFLDLYHKNNEMYLMRNIDNKISEFLIQETFKQNENKLLRTKLQQISDQINYRLENIEYNQRVQREKIEQLMSLGFFQRNYDDNRYYHNENRYDFKRAIDEMKKSNSYINIKNGREIANPSNSIYPYSHVSNRVYKIKENNNDKKNMKKSSSVENHNS